MKLHHLGIALLAQAAMLFSPGVNAEADWPNRTVSVVLPFSAGGGTDALARIIATRMEEKLGRTFVVDNRPGAAGNVGAAYVANAKPDGYTLALHGTVIGLYPHLFPKLAYDPLKDFSAIGSVAETPVIVVTAPNSKYQTFESLIEAAKTSDRPFNYGTPGVGSPQQLAMERIASEAGIELQHIAYRGTSNALVDLIGGQLDFSVFTIAGALSQIQSNTLSVLTVIGEERSPLLPDVPAVAELGYPNLDAALNYFFLAPRGTPEAILNRANEVLLEITQEPEVIETLSAAGYQLKPSSPAEADAMVLEQYKVWGPIIQQLGLAER